MKIKSQYVLFLTMNLLPVSAFCLSVSLLNHYDNSLKFIVGINPEVLPDVTSEFNMEKQQKITSRVLDLHKEAYVRVEDEKENSAFWGIEIKDNQVKIYGYLSHGIAYSWDQQRIIFCTPEEYKKKNSC